MRIFVGRKVEPGSTLENKTKAWRGKHPVYKQKDCIGCQSCFLGCPEGTVFQIDKKKFDVNLDYCKGCGICAHECPVDDIEMVLETGCEEFELESEEGSERETEEKGSEEGSESGSEPEPEENSEEE